jgi:hypothetical protein
MGARRQAVLFVTPFVGMTVDKSRCFKQSRFMQSPFDQFEGSSDLQTQSSWLFREATDNGTKTEK